ncbi:MAG: hypothetical protein HYZ54_12480 [Ignavibacteriae bacterium]|nr:hypothetical protein [Ignavibacteriota bacterium]
MFNILKRITVVGFIGAIMIMIASCGDNIITDPSEIVFPDSNVSYKSHVLPLLSLSCAYIGCHNDESAAGNLRLTSHIAMFQHTGLIIRFKPDNSVLIQTIEGTLPHRATYRQDFNVNQKKGMRMWVLEGAKDN